MADRAEVEYSVQHLNLERTVSLHQSSYPSILPSTAYARFFFLNRFFSPLPTLVGRFLLYYKA